MTRWLVGVLLCSLALVGWACGSGSGSKSDTAAAERAAAKRKAQAEYTKCQSQLKRLIRTESDLNSHLDIGMNYNEYTTAVGDVKAVYDEVPKQSLDPTCLPVGVAAEDALNQYAKAAGVWDKCFSDINCSNDSIKPLLERRWSKASTYIDRAKTALDDIRNQAASGGRQPTSTNPQPTSNNPAPTSNNPNARITGWAPGTRRERDSSGYVRKTITANGVVIPDYRPDIERQFLRRCHKTGSTKTSCRCQLKALNRRFVDAEHLAQFMSHFETGTEAGTSIANQVSDQCEG